MISPLIPIISALWGRLQELREDDRGMTTETIIITALLAAAALAAVTAITVAIASKKDEVVTDING
jgi:hypothetical protein